MNSWPIFRIFTIADSTVTGDGGVTQRTMSLRHIDVTRGHWHPVEATRRAVCLRLVFNVATYNVCRADRADGEKAAAAKRRPGTIDEVWHAMDPAAQRRIPDAICGDGEGDVVQEQKGTIEDR